MVWAAVKRRQARNIRPWADLPDDLLELITKRLCLQEFLNFRRVCKAWRASSTKKYRNPFLVVSYQSREISPYIVSIRDHRSYNNIRGPIKRRYCIGSSHGWLIMRRDRPIECFLLNLFTGSEIKLPRWFQYAKFGQVYLSAPPTSDNCVVLVIGERLQGFAFCRPGDTMWTRGENKFMLPSNEGIKDYLQCAVALQGKFYILSYQGQLVTTDDVAYPQTLRVLPVKKIRPSQEVWCHHQYVVESQGEMLVVFLNSTIRRGLVDSVEVFRLDFPSMSWIKMESLGDRALFVGFNCSFSVSSNEISCRRDCIYFSNHWIDIWSVFDMEHQKVITHLNGGLWPVSHQNNRIWVLPTF